MRSLFAKFALHKTVGVYLDENEIALSEVAATPLGPVEITRRSVPHGSKGLATALTEALAPSVGRRRRPCPTAVGLPASRVFFNTRPVISRNDTSPEELLQQSLYSPNIRIDDYVIELIKAAPGKSPVASVAACRKKYLTAVMDGLNEAKIRPHRVEPGPCGLARVASHCCRAPRRAKFVLRVVCNSTQAMAILTSFDLPIAWRSIELPAGHETAAIVSVLRTLQGLASHYGMTEPLDLLVIHGRADLDEQLQDPRFGGAIGVPVICCTEPELGPGAVAFGLALGCLVQRGPAFDFSASLKPPASFWDIFPWGELALEGALILFMAMFLWRTSDNLDRSYRVVHAEIERHKDFHALPVAHLERENAELRQKVDAIRQYLDSRLPWTSYMHDFSAHIPAHVTLLSFLGQWELGNGSGNARPKRCLVLSASVPIAPNGSMPREIDALLSILRNDPLLKRDFPRIELAGIRRSKSYGAQSTAELTVVCQPGAGGPNSKAR
jgi:hypothetical protein